LVRALEVSRDGRRLVYLVSSERRLLLHDFNEFESRPLPGTEGATRPFLSPDGRWIGFYQAGKIRKLAFEGGDPTDVAEAPVDSPGAAWGPDNAVFFSRAWTESGLWRVDAAGGKPVELTQPDRAKGETAHFWPDILPDGKAALFTIFGGVGLADSKVGLLDLQSRRYDILLEGAAARYVASGHIVYYRGGAYRSVPFDPARRRVTGAEATVLRQVRRRTPEGSAESFASFGAAGVLAYVEGDSTPDQPPSRLAWVSREGHLTELPFEGNHGGFRLSPDGTRVAVQRFASGQQQIHLYDLERGTSEPLTRDGMNFDPAWHPDGRRVAFTSLLSGSFDVRWAPADGSAQPAPLVATTGDEGTWQWAPDARSAIFVVWSAVSGTDLWQADGSGANPKALLASPLSETDAAFSADGQWLAYVSGESLYVAPYPSPGQRVLIAAGASSPRWSRSTPELFYVETGQLKSVAYDARGGAFRAGTPRTLFALGRLRPAFDVAPDGKRFLFLAETGEHAGRDVIRVVLNGFDMLRAGATREAAR
jgi:serine/threonine-protein kinase